MVIYNQDNGEEGEDDRKEIKKQIIEEMKIEKGKIEEIDVLMEDIKREKKRLREE